MEIKETIEFLKDLDKVPEVYLYFGADDDYENRKKVKFIPKFSAYTLEKMISIIQSRKNEPFVDYLRDLKKGIKKNEDEIKLEDYIKAIEKNKHEFYTKEDLNSWLTDKKSFIDKGVLREESRINIEIFKLVINKFKDAEDVTYSPEEIALINSEWTSDFWKKQDRLSIAESSWFFRNKNGIGLKIDRINF